MKNAISKHLHWIIYAVVISMILAVSIYLGEQYKP